ncbi:hypothetical protein CONLIGDRAFT_676868 [Coniochaeta ligniaria NRRL 30616]|uniref:Uncharacterized protein n=1 Tax=Coniochaeta ligniaria NRRL 30616 TaxID=1408157 RepID=A0A1J7JYZ4_9PEZI|nr:hypothetical protein CONLIGDRAFT_676868 [Coniochaeta ligniaria NRRL 30616]
MEDHQKRQSVGTVQLPVEILLAIFDNFRRSGHPVVDRRERFGQLSDHEYREKRDRYDNEERACRTTVCNARLVCRLFNELASPLLLPGLCLHVDQASLDLVDAVSRSSLVASGVQVLNVVLRYRPRGAADDFDLFKTLVHKRLDNIQRESVRNVLCWKGGYRLNKEHKDYAQYKEVLDILENVRYACTDGHCDGSDEDYYAGLDMELRIEEYRRLLPRAHQEYSLRHDEQIRLMTTGSFVKRVAASMAKLPRAASLVLLDQPYRGHDDWDWHTNQPKHVLTDMGEFSRYLASSLSWGDIYDGEYDNGLPWKILSELPIAIHKAGTQLKSLCIYSIPPARFLAMEPFQARRNEDGEMSGATAALEDLCTASQHLETFHLDPGPWGRSFHAADYNQADLRKAMDCMNTFLRCFVSSAALQDLHLELYKNHLDNPSAGPWSYYPLDPVLSVLPDLPRLRRLTLRKVQATEEQLTKFCGRLGAGTLESVMLRDVQVTGRWEMVTGILEEKTAAKCGDGSFFELALLYGEVPDPTDTGIRTWCAGLAKAVLHEENENRSRQVKEFTEELQRRAA